MSAHSPFNERNVLFKVWYLKNKKLKTFIDHILCASYRKGETLKNETVTFGT